MAIPDRGWIKRVCGFSVLAIALGLCLWQFARRQSVTNAGPATAKMRRLKSLDEGLKAAQASGRDVLVNFTGLGWCHYCTLLERQVFSQPEFSDIADHFVLVELDFPETTPQPDDVKQSNAALQAQFGVTGFPTLILVSPDGRELGRHVGYLAGGAAAFTSLLQGWMEGSRGVVEEGPVSRRTVPAK